MHCLNNDLITKKKGANHLIIPFFYIWFIHFDQQMIKPIRS